MKYLVNIKPPKELSQKIENYRKEICEFVTKEPSNEPHLALMTLYSDISNEKHIVNELERISWFNFFLETGELDVFEKDSLVLKVKDNKPIRDLHKNIIDSLKEYINWEENPRPNKVDDNERKEAYKKYGSPCFERFYNPHITIAQVDSDKIFCGSEIYRSNIPYERWEVDEFHLSKKDSDNWKKVAKFYPK